MSAFQPPAMESLLLFVASVAALVKAFDLADYVAAKRVKVEVTA